MKKIIVLFLILVCKSAFSQNLTRRNFNTSSGNSNVLTYTLGDLLVLNSPTLGVGSQPGEGLLTSNSAIIFANLHHFYPNPFKTELVIGLGIPNRSAKLVIYDFMGRLIHTEILKEAVQTLNLLTLPDGMYFAEILIGRNSSTHKIIKTSL